MATLATIAGVGAGLSLLSEAGAREAQAVGVERGAEQQAAQERLAREFAQEQFEKQIERQEPFRQVGVQALPQLVESIAGRGDVSGLPATQIQQSLISEFLGEQAPGFVGRRATEGLEAVEQQRNIGRLADLVNIGAGGVGAGAASRVGMGTTLGRSLAQEAGTQAQALGQAATMRQQAQRDLFGGLAGLPSVIAAARTPEPIVTQGGFGPTAAQMGIPGVITIR
jgi:hypothetical protein